MTPITPDRPQASPILRPSNDRSSLSTPETASPQPTTASSQMPLLPSGSALAHLDLIEQPAPSLQAVRTQGLLLTKGQQGAAIKELQQRLSQVGYGVASTGVYGPSTEQVVKQFQKDTGLTPNGQVGPTTLKTLDGYLAQGNSPLAKKLAKTARTVAASRGTIGWCYNAVATSIESHLKPFLSGEHAYLAAPQLAHHPRFREIAAPKDMTKLPVGAVVVWGKGSSPSGHISVYLGGGQEASDHIESQMQAHYGGAKPRVFVPH